MTSASGSAPSLGRGAATWPLLLDALEERALELGAALARGERDVVVRDLPLAADGALPPELRLRAQAVLAHLQQVQAELARLTGSGARAAATYASH